MKAPFPWFGGKSRAAHLVWPRLGPVRNYVEPFAGSLAVLLKRPSPPKIETVNDKDCYLANFWRALQRDPEAVAYYADWPVNEADLHSRHRWLVARTKFRRRMLHNPDFYDPKIAGWWVWGQCLWIGSGWCARPDWRGRVNAGRYARADDVSTRNGDTSEQAGRPHLTNDVGVHTQSAAEYPEKDWNAENQARRPQLANDRGDKLVKNRGGNGVHAVGLTQKRPAHSGNGGAQGVHRRFEGNAAEQAKQPRAESNVGVHRDWQKRPRTDGDAGVHAQGHRRWQGGGAGGGSGVHAPGLWQQMPDLSGSRGASGRGIHGVGPRTDGLYDYLGALAERLRRVRVCCGDWSRVLTPSVTTYIGTTGVLLDPPYSQDRRAICYSEDHDVSADVRRWAIEHGENPQFRIALCGYEGEHDMPSGWTVAEWKAHGGYSRSERGVANREAERIWFSPHCLMPGRRGQQVLFFDEVAS